MPISELLVRIWGVLTCSVIQCLPMCHVGFVIYVSLLFVQLEYSDIWFKMKV